MSTILPNPFETDPEIKQGLLKKLQTKIPKRIGNAIYSTSPEKGTLQAVQNHLIKKLYDEMQRRNLIGIFSQEKFFDFVSRSRLVLPGESNVPGTTPTGTLSEANGRNDRRRKASRDTKDKTTKGGVGEIQE